MLRSGMFGMDGSESAARVIRVWFFPGGPEGTEPDEPMKLLKRFPNLRELILAASRRGACRPRRSWRPSWSPRPPSIGWKWACQR